MRDIGCATKQGSPLTPGDAARAQPRRVRQRESLAIVRVECFYFQRGAVALRKQCHAAIGHGAVYVHQQHADAAGTLFERGRDLPERLRWWGQ